jgi:hypothetical protein
MDFTGRARCLAAEPLTGPIAPPDGVSSMNAPA